ncbi:MAG TPA: PIN domain-containing protein [Candidatus Acidoferrales bacterium]|nr:PIN domain-containing protein [Candidatus Acidoferrales bacterium]
MNRVLVDAGPLVAILSERDERHRLCVRTLESLSGSPFSCWPVITEAAWLLRAYPGVVSLLLRRVSEGVPAMLPLSSLEARPVGDLMKKYESMKPQLADASLVYLADRESLDTIFTLDRRDFSVYRSARNRRFRLIPDLP